MITAIDDDADVGRGAADIEGDQPIELPTPPSTGRRLISKRPFFSNYPPKRIRMGEKLDPEAKRLRNVSSGELADAIGALEARVEAAV